MLGMPAGRPSVVGKLPSPPRAWSAMLAANTAWYSGVSGASCPNPHGLVWSWEGCVGSRRNRARHWPFQSGYCALSAAGAPLDTNSAASATAAVNPRSDMLSLLQLDVGATADIGPHLGFDGDRMDEFLRGAADRRGCHRGELLLHVAHLNDLAQCGFEFLDDAGRRRGRGENAAPQLDIEVGHAGLGHGRHVGQIVEPAVGGDGKRAHLAGLYLRRRRRRVSNGERRLAADDADQHLVAALVRDR